MNEPPLTLLDALAPLSFGPDDPDPIPPQTVTWQSFLTHGYVHWGFSFQARDVIGVPIEVWYDTDALVGVRLGLITDTRWYRRIVEIVEKDQGERLTWAISGITERDRADANRIVSFSVNALHLTLDERDPNFVRERLVKRRAPPPPLAADRLPVR